MTDVLYLDWQGIAALVFIAFGLHIIISIEIGLGTAKMQFQPSPKIAFHFYQMAK